MKKIYFYKMILCAMLTVLCMRSSYGQGQETFDNTDTSSSTRYKTRTWTGNDGSIWTATNSRTSGADINGTAIGLNDDVANTYVESGTISKGIGSITLTFKQFFSGSDTGTLTIYVNNSEVGMVTYNGDENSSSTTASINNINVSGDFILRIANETGGDNNGGDNRIAIDDIIWTSHSSTNPTIGFDSSLSSETEINTSFNTVVPISMINYTSTIIIDISVHESSTAETNDYSLNTTSLTFNSNSTQNVSIDINNDTDIENETIVLSLTISDGNADVSISQHTISLLDDDQALVINEIHADPDSSNGDANGDGQIDTADDEFVEIYNTSGSDLDISNWILADATKVRHTFPYGTIIPKEQTIVVFGAGTPVTVPGLVQVASSGFLSLNNSGDTITIRDENDTLILTEIYSSAGNNQSIARNDDINGTFVDHSHISTNPILFSPGRDNTTNISFSPNIKWIGATNNDWNTSSNWLDDSIPNSISNVIIPEGLTNYPTISTEVTVSSIQMSSGTSLIANAPVTGLITYKRNLPNTNWHLVSPPVSGETIEDLISNNSFASGTGTNIGIAPYNNDGTAWDYQTSSSTGGLVSGQGISVKLNSSGFISFTGSLNVDNISYPITQNTSNFNLVGNPFTSYVNSATFTTENSGILSEETIWLWDGTQYITYNAASPIELAPGQGFFLEASRNGSVIFSSSNQSHQTTDTFMRSSESLLPAFELFINGHGKQKSTKVFYIDDKTTGFDNGYDSSMFSEDSSDMAVFTQLVSDNEGKQLAIQTLPNNSYETIVIPVGLNFQTGNITFSANTLNFPTDVKIILEDRVNEVLTDLSEQSYSVVLNENAHGIGQFYVHTSRDVLGINSSESLNNISIYKSANNSITINGLQVEKASLTIYSIVGKKIMSSKFSSNGNSIISIPKLSTGVYLIEINSPSEKINKKIVIN
ncbi:Por secretion system C-terminal sorting domain-containing protein [Tenacibaculum sp. MAR_2009_124]|uniref:lamin tail domain-containing protein n=1 Tax=Tenacibaculum sp. MAR_2009_124 TaxID=1250059 RepID=UPI00089A4DDC|nr:lamin tail domain-containing protein [Tenacibaculum sp. MAR_2009_124]SEC85050.1 Por secretion system C-terminal sorting domain-containing protein [Tenacibaculum sp. MAR_2009_124]